MEDPEISVGAVAKGNGDIYQRHSGTREELDDRVVYATSVEGHEVLVTERKDSEEAACCRALTDGEVAADVCVYRAVVAWCDYDGIAWAGRIDRCLQRTKRTRCSVDAKAASNDVAPGPISCARVVELSPIDIETFGEVVTTARA